MRQMKNVQSIIVMTTIPLTGLLSWEYTLANELPHFVGFFRETFWDWPYWIFKRIFDENDLIVLILSVHAKKLVPPVHFDFDVSWISLIF